MGVKNINKTFQFSINVKQLAGTCVSIGILIFFFPYFILYSIFVISCIFFLMSLSFLIIAIIQKTLSFPYTVHILFFNLFLSALTLLILFWLKLKILDGSIILENCSLPIIQKEFIPFLFLFVVLNILITTLFKCWCEDKQFFRPTDNFIILPVTGFSLHFALSLIKVVIFYQIKFEIVWNHPFFQLRRLLDQNERLELWNSFVQEFFNAQTEKFSLEQARLLLELINSKQDEMLTHFAKGSKVAYQIIQTSNEALAESVLAIEPEQQGLTWVEYLNGLISNYVPAWILENAFILDPRMALEKPLPFFVNWSLLVALGCLASLVLNPATPGIVGPVLTIPEIIRKNAVAEHIVGFRPIIGGLEEVFSAPQLFINTDRILRIIGGRF